MRDANLFHVERMLYLIDMANPDRLTGISLLDTLPLLLANNGAHNRLACILGLLRPPLLVRTNLMNEYGVVV
jgi:hypothetical protein